MGMKNPPHPGQHIRLDCLGPLNLSVTGERRCLASPGKPSTPCKWQEWHFAGDGRAALQGLRRQPCGVAEDADGVRSRQVERTSAKIRVKRVLLPA